MKRTGKFLALMSRITRKGYLISTSYLTGLIDFFYIASYFTELCMF